MSPTRESVARLSIGALSRATGVPVETLRTWEARYGFPIPERKASGHRVYRTTSVPRLRRIAAALSQGHRAGEVVGASDAELEQLLAATSTAGTGGTAGEHRPARTEELLALVERFDSQQLTLRLLSEAARRGPFAFVRDCIAPLITAVGDSWAEGRLSIHHEHFLSERVGDLLRSQRMPFEERASGPMVILGSLPGEAHALGLQMAALVLSAAGCRVLHLGTELPPSSSCRWPRTREPERWALACPSTPRGRRPRARCGVSAHSCPNGWPSSSAVEAPPALGTASR